MPEPTLGTAALAHELVAGFDSFRFALVGHLAPLVWLNLVICLVLIAVTLKEWLEPFRRASRGTLLWIMSLCAVGLLARAYFIPVFTAHVFDGHEADFYDIWRGLREVGPFAVRSSYLLRLVYHALGPVFDGSATWLLWGQLLSSLLVFPLTWLWLRELTGSERAGLWAGALLILDPVLCFWSSSAYNLHQPFVVGIAVLFALERALKRGNPWLLACAVALWAAGVGLRLETILLAFPLLARLLMRTLEGRVRWGQLLALVATSPLVLMYLVSAARRSLEDDTGFYLVQMFGRQLFLLDFYAPYPALPASLAVGMACLYLLWHSASARRLLATALLILLPQHLAYAAFDDFDFRHTLFARLALACLVGTSLALFTGLETAPAGLTRSSALRGKSWYVYLIAVCVLLATILPLGYRLNDVSQRYYATAARFYALEPRLQTAPYVSLDALQGCVLVAENPFFLTRPHASHFELYDARLLAGLQARYNGCILFVYDVENFQASSRAVDGRALKLQRFFHMRLLGRFIDREREVYALIFRLEDLPSPVPAVPASRLNPG